jgi:hypothetical protein
VVSCPGNVVDVGYASTDANRKDPDRGRHLGRGPVHLPCSATVLAGSGWQQEPSVDVVYEFAGRKTFNVV